MSDFIIVRDRACQQAAGCVNSFPEVPLPLDRQMRLVCRRFAVTPAMARTVANLAFAEKQS
jgi:hypothetical protein